MKIAFCTVQNQESATSSGDRLILEWHAVRGTMGHTDTDTVSLYSCQATVAKQQLILNPCKMISGIKTFFFFSFEKKVEERDLSEKNFGN